MWGIIRGKAGGWYDRGQITDRLHKSSGLYESPSVVNVDAESRFADFDAEAEARWRFIRWVGVNIVIASGQRPFEIIWPSRRPSTICPFESQLNDCQQTDLFSLGKTSKNSVQCKFATANYFFFLKCALRRFVRGVWFDRNINISPTCLSTNRRQQPQILQRSNIQTTAWELIWIPIMKTETLRILPSTCTRHPVCTL